MDERQDAKAAKIRRKRGKPQRAQRARTGVFLLLTF